VKTGFSFLEIFNETPRGLASKETIA
jgi:hypothetical protein